MKYIDRVEEVLTDKPSSVSGIQKKVEEKVRKDVNWNSVKLCLIELEKRGKAESIDTEQKKELWKKSGKLG
ncbi:MAG: hypothetical protein HY516_03935 [Candidatus Aenigmarchaeota archaeon]|nr:hypothetical protein [Candidatus Aenigmarchaeota archaeon]